MLPHPDDYPDKYVRRWGMLILVACLLIMLVSAVLPAESEAHQTPAWKCRYIDAPDGWNQYRWEQQRCRPWRTTHMHYHRHGWLWPCKVQRPGPSRNECVIRKLFGKEGGTRLANKAVSVATCESTLRRHASNGRYRGLFQLGPHERAAYGYGSSAIEQTQGAIRLYRARGWQPWSCA